MREPYFWTSDSKFKETFHCWLTGIVAHFFRSFDFVFIQNIFFWNNHIYQELSFINHFCQDFVFEEYLAAIYIHLLTFPIVPCSTFDTQLWSVVIAKVLDHKQN